MKVAAIQMVSETRVDANLAAAHALVAQAAAAGAELCALPEYFCVLGRHDRDKLALQEPFGNGPIQDWLAATACEFQVWLAGGTLPLSTKPRDDAHVYNTSLVFAPSGECVARYDKMHLFRFDDGVRHYDESRTLVAGDEPVSFALKSRDGHCWQVGLSVCYDLRFPELYRHYARAGAELLLVPSAFTYSTGQVHWEALLRARAIENLCAVAAPAQGGEHENGRRTWGHTLVASAWGEVLALRDQGAGIVLADLDANAIGQRRAQLPALEHRRL